MANGPESVLVRDSTAHAGPVMVLSRDDWRLFVRQVRWAGSAAREGSAVSVMLPCDRSAPSCARRLVRHRLAHHRTEVLDAVELCTSETVTNAVVHSGAGPDEFVMLVLVETDERIRVEVIDNGHGGLPLAETQNRTRDAESGSAEAEDGRGLLIVAVLSAAFGVCGDGDGKSVWFEVDAQRGKD